MQITDIDKKTDQAIIAFQLAVDRVEREADNYETYPQNPGLNNKPKNYEKLAFELFKIIEQLKIFKNIHRFFKINDVLKDTLYQNYINGNETMPVIIAIEYIVTDEDTLGGIGLRHGVDWQKIAEYNGLDSMDLTAGETIFIPREFDPKIILNYNETINPVFDLPEGENVLGKDLPNSLEVDANGDLQVLNPRSTFLQGLENILHTHIGGLPFFPTWGFDSTVGDDIPREVANDWRKNKIQASLYQDKRVFEVPSDEITITRNGGEGLEISINVYPIQGLNFETLTLETQFQ